MHTSAKFLGGHILPFEKALNDIARVAQQSAWLFAIMAMIGAYAAALYRRIADGASSALKLHQRRDVGGAEPGSRLANVLVVRGKALRVGLDLLPIFGMSLLVALAALLSAFWLGIMQRASGFDRRFAVVLLAVRAYLLAVGVVMSVGVSQIFRPFLLRAFGFPLTSHSFSPRDLRVV